MTLLELVKLHWCAGVTVSATIVNISLTTGRRLSAQQVAGYFHHFNAEYALHAQYMGNKNA